MRWAQIASAGALWAALAAPAGASDALPPELEPTRPEQNLEQGPRIQSSPRRGTPLLRQQQPPEHAEAITFVFRTLTIEGATALKPHALRLLWSVAPGETASVAGTASSALGAEGLRVGVSALHSRSDPETAFLEALEFLGETTSARAFASYPLLRWRTCTRCDENSCHHRLCIANHYDAPPFHAKFTQGIVDNYTCTSAEMLVYLSNGNRGNRQTDRSGTPYLSTRRRHSADG